jgi:hypothetical protein
MNAGPEKPLGIPKSSKRPVKELSKMPKVFGNAVCDASFEVVPNKFVGVKLRRVSREVKGLDARNPFKDLSDKLGPVERAFVPENEELAGKVTSQVLNKFSDLRGTDVFAVETGVKSEPFSFGRDADGRDRRDFSPASCNRESRSSALRRPRFLDVRNQRESALVEEDQTGSKPRGLFLYEARRVASSTEFPLPVFPWPSWSAPGNSSPDRPSNTKDLRCNNRLETSCVPPSRSVSESKRLSGNRLPEALSRECVAELFSVGLRDAKVFRDGVSALSLSSLSCGRPAANAPGSLSMRPVSRPLRDSRSLVSKAGRPCVVAFPIAGVCHEVSLLPPGLPLYDRPELLSIEL